MNTSTQRSLAGNSRVTAPFGPARAS
ncbi:hypothetical protein HaLaN_12735, partial [Haematococcus lacustris]